MSDRARPRRSIGWGVFTIACVAVVCTTLVAGVGLHLELRGSIGPSVERLLVSDLQRTVQQAAAGLSGDGLASVVAQGTSDTDGYRALREQLRVVQRDRALSTDIYTLHLDQRGEGTTFGISCKEESLLGQPYLLKDEMRAVFAGSALGHTGVYADEHGIWISAYAPIRDAEGQVVGIVEADHDLRPYVAETRARVASAFALAAFAALLLVLPLAWWFSRRLVRPLRQLTRVAQRISEGDVEDLDVVGNHREAPGEIGLLAESFDRAAVATRYYVGRTRDLEEKLKGEPGRDTRDGAA